MKILPVLPSKNAPVAMVVILLPKVTLVRLSQSLNAEIPIDVQLERSMSVRAVHFRNAQSPIVVQPERFMLVSPVHSSNALHPIDVQLLERVTLVIPLQFLNTHRPRDAQFERSRLPLRPES